MALSTLQHHLARLGQEAPVMTAKKSDEGDAAIPSTETRTQPQTYTVEEAGQILRISRGNAYARAKDGSLPTIRMGHRRLVPKAALDKLLMV
jgi:excisionase family DNA binding protein